MKQVPWLVVAVVVIAFLVMRGFSSDATARALQRADTAESQVRSLTVERAALVAENAELAAAQEAVDAAYADSVAVWEATRSAAERRAVQAAQRASGLADSFRAQLDSVGQAQLVAYESEWQAVVAAKDEVIVTLEGQVSGLEGRVAARDSLILGLRAELVAGQAIEAGLRSANDALHDAVRSQNRQTWVLRGVGTVLLAKVAYDALK